VFILEEIVLLLHLLLRQLLLLLLQLLLQLLPQLLQLNVLVCFVFTEQFSVVRGAFRIHAGRWSSSAFGRYEPSII